MKLDHEGVRHGVTSGATLGAIAVGGDESGRNVADEPDRESAARRTPRRRRTSAAGSVTGARWVLGAAPSRSSAARNAEALTSCLRRVPRSGTPSRIAWSRTHSQPAPTTASAFAGPIVSGCAPGSMRTRCRAQRSRWSYIESRTTRPRFRGRVPASRREGCVGVGSFPPHPPAWAHDPRSPGEAWAGPTSVG